MKMRMKKRRKTKILESAMSQLMMLSINLKKVRNMTKKSLKKILVKMMSKFLTV